MKENVMWMLSLKEVGFIVLAAYTRKDLIAEAEWNYSLPWKELRKRGYSAVKVTVSPFKKNKEKTNPDKNKRGHSYCEECNGSGLVGVLECPECGYDSEGGREAHMTDPRDELIRVYEEALIKSKAHDMECSVYCYDQCDCHAQFVETALTQGSEIKKRMEEGR